MNPGNQRLSAATVRSSRDDAGRLRLGISGRLDAQSSAAAWRDAQAALGAPEETGAIVDVSGIEYCDGAGIGLLFELKRRYAGKEGALEIRGLAEDFRRLLDQFDPADFGPSEEGGGPTAVSVVEEVGRASVEIARDICSLVVFVGELGGALVHALRNPRKVRWRDTFLVAELAGVNALPIVVLVGFLLGLIMAFQAAIPMRQFGVEIYVADLVALSVIRELGPLMTAIILAGRSASAFAAEIGTMKVNEEIDALKTMGLDSVRFVVVPRVIAGVALTPLLTLFAHLAGLTGGAIVLLSMGYPLVTYVNEALGAVDLADFLGGMAKSFVFGILIAGIGCLRGLQTRTGPAAVGESTTRAVVSGIVLIAITDGLFSVVYYYLDI
jgi:phospholipid/cholesterol/gamma-HCH transport system permease protein